MINLKLTKRERKIIARAIQRETAAALARGEELLNHKETETISFKCGWKEIPKTDKPVEQVLAFTLKLTPSDLAKPIQSATEHLTNFYLTKKQKDMQDHTCNANTSSPMVGCGDAMPKQDPFKEYDYTTKEGKLLFQAIATLAVFKSPTDVVVDLQNRAIDHEEKELQEKARYNQRQNVKNMFIDAIRNVEYLSQSYLSHSELELLAKLFNQATLRANGQTVDELKEAMDWEIGKTCAGEKEAINQIEELAKFISQHFPDDIKSGGAVDVAIAIINRLNKRVGKLEIIRKEVFAALHK